MTRLLNIEVLGLGVTLSLDTEVARGAGKAVKSGLHKVASKVAEKTKDKEQVEQSATHLHEFGQ